MTKQRATPHDIFQAWQDGVIDDQEAMKLTACESVVELYLACKSSGVDILRPMKRTPGIVELPEAVARQIEALADTVDGDGAASRGPGGLTGAEP